MDTLDFSTRMMSQTLKLMILLNLLKTMMTITISLPKIYLGNMVNVASLKMFVDMETKDVIMVGGVKVEADAEEMEADVVLQ